MRDAIAALENFDLARFRVTIVDDGSDDDTGAIAERMAAADPRITVVHHARNGGYGAAIKSGLAAADLDWVFYTDGDGQFDVAELASLLPWSADHDAVIGYRVRRSDHALRKVNQMLWSRLVRWTLRIDVRDVDCAFKLLRRSLVEAAGPYVSDGAVISAELLVKLDRAGARIKQVPVGHRPRLAGEPSGGSPRVIARAFRELFRLRRALRRPPVQPSVAPDAPTGPTNSATVSRSHRR